jgi:metallo-beta-lactamase family protein
MIIHFNGAARTVTGSQYLLEINGKRLLLECGLFQGRREDTYKRNQYFPFDVGTLDAVVLSHAHIDHSGNLPNLVKNGYAGPIYATPATCKLGAIMLLDAGHIQEADTEFINKKNFRRGLPPAEPLYTLQDAMDVEQYFRPVEYGKYFEPIPGVNVHFVEAGHILGSAAVVLDIEEQGRKFRYWFSGDIGRFDLPLLRDPVLPTDVDYLMMECTYGDKVRTDTDSAKKELRDVILRTVKRGGKIIIPAFAVGRTQELIYDLLQLITTRDVPPLPIYIDSPLAMNASAVFEDFPQYYDDEAQKYLHPGRNDIFEFKQLHFVESADESKALNDKREPMVIISASGMAESGRIRHHLRNNIEDAKNTIVIVGWQSPETLGRHLAEKDAEVKIFGEWYRRKADVATIGGFSAHGDQTMLMKYARSASSPRLKKIILVHGEDRAEQPFSTLLQELKVPVEYPDLFSTMEI